MRAWSRVLVDEDLADAALELSARHGSRVTPSHSTIPGTATTSSPRTTSGHPSRSERGILASTNTSWIFFDRPASRSPGRHPRTLSPGSSAVDAPGAPAHLAVEVDRRPLEPEAVVLAHRLDAAAEVDALRARPARRAARRARAAASAAPRARAGRSRARPGGAARAAAGSRAGSGRAPCRAFEESSRNASPRSRQ